MNAKDIALAFLVVVIWGTNFSFIKIGLEQWPPLLFSALRFFVVAVPAIFFIRFPTKVWKEVIAVGALIGVLKFSFVFWGMKQDVSAGMASLLIQAQVFFTIGLAALIFHEKISKIQFLGLFCAMGGLLIFVFNTGHNITQLGLLLMILASICWALANVVMKKLKDINLLHFMVWVSVIPPLPLFLMSYFLESSSPIELILSASMSKWLALAYVSYLSTLAAYAIWGHLMKSHSAASVTPFALLIPVVGILVSGILLGEQLTSIEWIGSAVIMMGLVICVLGNRWLPNK